MPAKKALGATRFEVAISFSDEVLASAALSEIQKAEYLGSEIIVLREVAI